MTSQVYMPARRRDPMGFWSRRKKKKSKSANADEAPPPAKKKGTRRNASVEVKVLAAEAPAGVSLTSPSGQSTVYCYASS